MLTFLVENLSPRVVVAAGSVHTALGSVGTSIPEFVKKIGTVGIGLGGFAAIALLSVGAITILTSAGNADKLIEGREMITNALMGLALILLALAVVQFLGGDLLGIDKGLLGFNYDFSKLG